MTTLYHRRISLQISHVDVRLLFAIGIDLSKKPDTSTAATTSASADKDKSKDDGRKSTIPVGIAVARQREGVTGKKKSCTFYAAISNNKLATHEYGLV